VEKPVPAMVAETDVLTIPDVGLIELTVAAVALVTVNPLVSVAVPPSLLTTTTFQDPGVTPFRENEVVIWVAETKLVSDPGIFDCPDIVSRTVAPETNPVPVIVTPVTYPLL